MSPQPVRTPRRLRVTPRARIREDRAGDPLDGLVNLFDLGIVLAVAFLLAALSSLDLTSSVLKRPEKPAKVPSDAVVANRNAQVSPIQIAPGQRVVGRGTAVGTVYRLRDGRTILVTNGATGASGAASATGTSTSTGPTASSGASSPSDTGSSGDSSSSSSGSGSSGSSSSGSSSSSSGSSDSGTGGLAPPGAPSGSSP